MSDGQSALSGRVDELRRAFDQSFAEPVLTSTRTTIDFISVRLGGDLHAVRVSEIGGLYADVKITPCPSPEATLHGIAGFRGTLTPVYDLPALLGYPMSSGRWLVLAAGGALALAFNDFEGHFRVEPEAIASRNGASGAVHVHEIARLADVAWPVIDIPSVVSAIGRRVHDSTPSKE